MDYDAGDVVIVPFPFTDQAATKRRPALVLSDRERFNAPTGQLLLAMITTAKHSAWALDCAIADPAAAGLDTPCIVRMKLFTLDARLVIRCAGTLASEDMAMVRSATTAVLG